MPNPSQALNNPALVEAGTSASSIEVDPLHFHELQHLSVDTGGSAATTSIFLAFGAQGETVTPVASHAASANKCVLPSGGKITIKPGCSKIAFITASGSPVFQITPQTRTLSA